MSEDKVRTQEVEQLLKAITTLTTEDEVYAVLRDLCTVREIEDMALRLKIARMLDAGESYAAVEQATKVSSTTIARVSKSLNYGYDGYRVLLDRIQNTDASASAPEAE